jgi:uncharacterized short protein YbdD (DUF466 family)
VHRNNILIQKSQQEAYVTGFILSDDCCTCFGYFYHPSSGAPIISVSHRHHVYVSNHMKTKHTNTPPTTHSNQFQLFHDSSRQQYGMYIIHYSIELTVFSAEYTLFNNNCNFNLVYRYSLSINLTLSITV